MALSIFLNWKGGASKIDDAFATLGLGNNGTFTH